MQQSPTVRVAVIGCGGAAWVAAAPDGRFDASNLDADLPLHWIVADRPVSPLPLEIFMKDYFEPRLLPRLLAGEEFGTNMKNGNFATAETGVKSASGL